MAAVDDLTKTELIAKIDDTALATWWTSAPALPSGIDLSELFVKSLKAAYLAQVTKNASAAVGERLNSYAAPASGTVQLDTATGIQSYTNTCAVTVRTTSSLDVSVRTLI